MAELRFATVRLSTGPRIHYAEQGDGDGLPVLFLHGWPDSWFTFSRVLPHLWPRLRVFVIDQRGFGESEKPEAGYAIEDLAADAAAFLDAVGIGRAAVVGHSFGSFVARAVTLAHPARVTRLALVGTGVSGGTPVVREAQAALTELPDPVPLEFVREFQAGTAHVPLPEAFFEAIVAESLKLPARLWRTLLDSLIAYDDEHRLTRIETPTLIMWGEHDALFPRAHQDRLMQTLMRAELIVYPDTGHCPNWERPDRFAADLQAFLTREAEAVHRPVSD